MDELSIICDRGDECASGQNATFAGILALSENLNSGLTYVSAHFEVFHVNVQTIYRKKSLNLCESITSISGEETCPSVGTYDFIFQHELPKLHDMLTGWTLKLVVVFHGVNNEVLGHFEALVTQKAELSTSAGTTLSHRQSTQRYASILGSMALLGIGCFVKKKYRKAEVWENEHDNKFVRFSDEVEMSKRSKGESAFV